MCYIDILTKFVKMMLKNKQKNSIIHVIFFDGSCNGSSDKKVFAKINISINPKISTYF